MLALRPAWLLLALLCEVTIASAQPRELPQHVEDDLGRAKLAARSGDPGPALATIARLGSAGLTAHQRSLAARRLQELDAILLAQKVPGAALDVARSLARASADLPEGVASTTAIGVALRALGDDAAALKVFAGLVRPAPPKTPASVIRARTGELRSTLGRIGHLLLAQQRPAQALTAFLDARTVTGVRDWWWGTRGADMADEAKAIAALCPGRFPNLGEHGLAVAAAIMLTAPVEERAQDGRVVRCGLRVVDVLRNLARVWDHRKQPALGKAYRKAADDYTAPPRPYRLPRPNAESLLGFRVWRERLERERQALPAIRRQAKQSNPAAVYALARAQMRGEVVPSDDSRARALRRRAAALGHGLALLDRANRNGGNKKVMRALCVRALAAGERGTLEPLSHDLPPGPLTPKARVAARRLGNAGEGKAWIVLARDATSASKRRAFLLRAARLAEARSYQPLAELRAQGAPGLPADPRSSRLWKRCLALSDANKTVERWSALAQGAVERERLEAASVRYPGAAIELAWLALLASPPRPKQALVAGLRGLQIQRGRQVYSSETEATPLMHLVRRDPKQARAVQAVLARRTDPIARHLRGYLHDGALNTPALLLHRLEARSADRPACASLFARLHDHVGIAALQVEWRWATRAAKAGDAWAEAYRGQLLEGGLFGDPDRAAARDSYARAAKQGSRAAHLLLIRLERFLEDIAGRPRAAIDRHLRALAALGYAPAWARLAHRLERRGEPKQAKAAWAKGVAAADPTALLHAADALLNRAEPDWKGGLALVRRAAAGGSLPGYLRLLAVLQEQPSEREPNDP